MTGLSSGLFLERQTRAHRFDDIDEALHLITLSMGATFTTSAGSKARTRVEPRTHTCRVNRPSSYACFSACSSTPPRRAAAMALMRAVLIRPLDPDAT